MPSIIIHRAQEYLNRCIKYEVYINGTKAGSIANGDIKEFTTAPGNHSLVIKIDWCSSRTVMFEIGENEIKNFKVAGFKYNSWVMRTALVLMALHLIVKLKYDFDYFLYLAVLVFLILFYYMTIG